MKHVRTPVLVGFQFIRHFFPYQFPEFLFTSIVTAGAENPFEYSIVIWNFAVAFLSHTCSHMLLFTLLSFSLHLPKIKANLARHGYSYSGDMKITKKQLNEWGRGGGGKKMEINFKFLYSFFLQEFSKAKCNLIMKSYIS